MAEHEGTTAANGRGRSAIFGFSGVFEDEAVEPFRKDELHYVIRQLWAKYRARYPDESAQRRLAGRLFAVLVRDLARGPERGRFPRTALFERDLRSARAFRRYSDAAVQDAARNVAESVRRNENFRTSYDIGSVICDFWIVGPRPADRGEPGRGKLLFRVRYKVTGYRDQGNDAYFVGRRPLTNDPERPNRAITNPPWIEAAGVLEGGFPSIVLTWSGGVGPHTSFEIYRDGYLFAITREQRFVDRMVHASIGYAYNVRACNDAGCAVGVSSTARGFIAVSEVDDTAIS